MVKTRTRRIVGVILMAVGLVLAAVVVTVTVWTGGLFAAILAAGLIVGGWHLLTDRRPREGVLRDAREG